MVLFGFFFGGFVCVCGVFRSLTGLSSCVAMADVTFGVVVSAFCIGGLCGGLIGGKMADRVGRRGSAQIIAVVYVVAGSLLFVANSVLGLIIGRFVVGIACGASTAVVPLYLGEITPPSLRGAVGTLNQVMICIGIALSQFAGLMLATSWMWRVLLSLTGVPFIAQLVLLVFQPETPRYDHSSSHKESKSQSSKRTQRIVNLGPMNLRRREIMWKTSVFPLALALRYENSLTCVQPGI